MSDFESDFLAGSIACQKGLECFEGASDAFVRGFNTEYQREQMNTERSERETIRSSKRV